MNNHYEVTDLFEAGQAGEAIRANKDYLFDEVSGPQGPIQGVEDE